MEVLFNRFMHEPAVAIGVLLAAIVAGLKISSGGSLTADDFVAIFAPLGAGLGARPFVSPSQKA